MFTLMSGLIAKWIFMAGIILPTVLIILPAYAESDGKSRSGENTYIKVCGYCHDVGIGPVIKGRQLPPEYINARRATWTSSHAGLSGAVYR